MQSLFIGGSTAGTGGSADLTITDGGRVEAAQAVHFWNDESLTLDAKAALSVGSRPEDMHLQDVSDGHLHVWDGGLVRAHGDMTISPATMPNVVLEQGSHLDVDKTLRIAEQGQLIVDGGTLGFDELEQDDAESIDFRAGTFELTGPYEIGDNPFIQGMFGEAIHLDAHRGLRINGDAHIRTDLTIDGGEFRAQELVVHRTAKLTILGGTIGFEQYIDHGPRLSGKVDYESGIVEMGGDDRHLNEDDDINEFFGGTLIFEEGSGLRLNSAARLEGDMRVDGGVFSARRLDAVTESHTNIPEMIVTEGELRMGDDSSSHIRLGAPREAARFVQQGGEVSITGASSLFIGVDGTIGTYELEGGTLHTGRTHVSMPGFGEGGTGTFIQSGGTHTTQLATVGRGMGNYIHSGGVFYSERLTIGNWDSTDRMIFSHDGHYLLKEDGEVDTSRLEVGIHGNQRAEFEMVGGTLHVRDKLTLGGKEGKGHIIQEAGQHTVDGPAVIGQGRMELTGGAFSAESLTIEPAGHGLEAGLVVGKAAEFEVAKLLTVGERGTLTAEGKLAAATMRNDGLLTPGTSEDTAMVSTLTIDGDLEQSETGNLLLHIEGNPVHDQLTVLGDFKAGGKLTVAAMQEVSLQVGDSFEVLDWTGTITGTFDEVDLFTPGTGLTWDLDSLYTDGTIHIIPEPGTLALLGLGGLTLLRRRRTAG